MGAKLRSEGTRINSEIYAESLAGTEGSAKAERVIRLAPGTFRRRWRFMRGVSVLASDSGYHPRSSMLPLTRSARHLS